MILQNRRLPVAQGTRDPSAFLGVQDDALEVPVHAMRLVEAQRVLGEHLELAAEAGEGFAVHRVSVAGGVDIRAGFVDFGMDREGSGVDWLVALDDGAIFVDKDEVGYFDEGEVCGEGVEPCQDGERGLAGGIIWC